MNIRIPSIGIVAIAVAFATGGAAAFVSGPDSQASLAAAALAAEPASETAAPAPQQEASFEPSTVVPSFDPATVARPSATAANATFPPPNWGRLNPALTRERPAPARARPAPTRARPAPARTPAAPTRLGPTVSASAAPRRAHARPVATAADTLRDRTIPLAPPVPAPAAVAPGGVITRAVFRTLRSGGGGAALLAAAARTPRAAATVLETTAAAATPSATTTPSASATPSGATLAATATEPAASSRATRVRSDVAPDALPLATAVLLALVVAAGLVALAIRLAARRSRPTPEVEPAAAPSARPRASDLATVGHGSTMPAVRDEDAVSETERDEQIDLLRARIELKYEVPFSVVVTSALRGDGKNLCARRLAESMARVGYRTILVDLDAREPSVIGAPEATSATEMPLESHLVVEGEDVTETSLSHVNFTRTASLRRVRELLTRLRERFDAIVINGAPPTTSGVGFLFAVESGTVIVTLREGRALKAADRELSALIERESLPMLGVVSIAPASIREHERRPRPAVARPPSLERRSTPIPGGSKPPEPLEEPSAPLGLAGRPDEPDRDRGDVPGT